MKRTSVIALLAVVLSAPACDRKKDGPATTQAQDPPTGLDKGYPDRMVEKLPGKTAPLPAPIASPVPEATAGGTVAGACDLTTKESAVQVYAKLKGFELTGDGKDYGCAMLLPRLESALFGMMATEVGCIWTEIVHGCKLYLVNDASDEVLSSMGWATASKKERGSLALLWTEQVIFAEKEVLAQGTGAFEGQDAKFEKPAAKSLPSGGVEVRLWVRLAPGMSATSLHELHRVTFDADGALVGNEVASSFRAGGVGIETGHGPH